VDGGEIVERAGARNAYTTPARSNFLPVAFPLLVNGSRSCIAAASANEKPGLRMPIVITHTNEV